MTSTRPIQRVAGRALVIDSEQRVLLVQERIDVGRAETHWMTPGGGVEAGETPADAAVREVLEETGLAVVLSDVEPVHEERMAWVLDGQAYDQLNHYYVARVAQAQPTVRPAELTAVEARVYVSLRWWSLPELRATGETVWPRSLPTLLSAALADG